MDTDPNQPPPNDPFDAADAATSVGTDVSVGPGERIPETEGKRRPGQLADDPDRAPAPGTTPGRNPDNPGDDPGVATPQPQPDVLAGGGRAANDER